MRATSQCAFHSQSQVLPRVEVRLGGYQCMADGGRMRSRSMMCQRRWTRTTFIARDAGKSGVGDQGISAKFGGSSRLARRAHSTLVIRYRKRNSGETLWLGVPRPTLLGFSFRFFTDGCEFPFGPELFFGLAAR